jgi:hypothetical protein
LCRPPGRTVFNQRPEVIEPAVMAAERWNQDPGENFVFSWPVSSETRWTEVSKRIRMQRPREAFSREHDARSRYDELIPHQQVHTVLPDRR